MGAKFIGRVADNAIAFRGRDGGRLEVAVGTTLDGPATESLVSTLQRWLGYRMIQFEVECRREAAKESKSAEATDADGWFTVDGAARRERDRQDPRYEQVRLLVEQYECARAHMNRHARRLLNLLKSGESLVVVLHDGTAAVAADNGRSGVWRGVKVTRGWVDVSKTVPTPPSVTQGDFEKFCRMQAEGES